MNILICGFMGSGKTTFVESFRGNHLGYEAIDLDTAVAAGLGLMDSELGEWITEHGLETFRHKELATLKMLLAQRGPKLIALGGGTIEIPEFWELLAQNKLVFLDIPFETCLLRIKNDPNRPLTALGEEGLKALYEKRLPLYQKADLILGPLGIKEIEGLQSLVHNLQR